MQVLPQLAENNKKSIILLMVFYAFCVFFAVSFAVKFISVEDPVYHWDHVGFHGYFKSLGSLLSAHDFSSFFKTVLRSVRNDEYNVSSLLLPLLFEPLWGDGRTVYIVAVVITYLIPLCIIAPLVIAKLYRPQDNSSYLLSAVLTLLFLLYPALWRPTFMGLPDIAGLLPLCLVLFLAAKSDTAEKVTIRRMLLIGVAIYTCFLLRRWYTFTIASFYIAFALGSCINLKRVDWKKGLLKITANLLIASLATFLLIFLFQKPYLATIFSNNYAYAYTYYRLPVLENLHGLFTTYIGPVIALLAFSGIGLSFLRKQKVYAHVLVLLWLVMLLALFAPFTAFGPQHALPVVFLFLILASSGVMQIYSSLKKEWAKHLLALIVILFVLANFFSSLFGPYTLFSVPVFSSKTLVPLRHEAFDELKKLYSDIESLTAGTQDRVSVMASQGKINASLLMFNAPEAIRNRIVETSHVDKRDGIAVNPLLTRYTVVADPPLASTEQTVVTVPTQKLVSGTGIGAAYALVEAYDFKDGLKVYLFEKQRPFTPVEIEDYFMSFSDEKKTWPNNPTELDWLMLSAEIVIGKETGSFLQQGAGRYFITTGTNSSTRITLSSDIMRTFEFSLSIPSYAGSDGCGGELGGNVLYTVVSERELDRKELHAGDKIVSPIVLMPEKPVSLSFDPNGLPWCDHVYLELKTSK